MPGGALREEGAIEPSVAVNSGETYEERLMKNQWTDFDANNLALARALYLKSSYSPAVPAPSDFGDRKHL
jgi:hypothetical protein